MLCDVKLEIAEVEASAVVRAADHMKREGIRRKFIGSEDFGAVYFPATVQADKPGADGVSGSG